MSHKITKCKECQKVIVQCRCPKDHPIEWITCDECRSTKGEREKEFREFRNVGGIIYRKDGNEFTESFGIKDKIHLVEKSALDKAEARIAELERALNFAAGLISAMDNWKDRHPQEAYDWIVMEAQALKGGKK